MKIFVHLDACANYQATILTIPKDMSRLQSIENALTNINEAVFQELCDCLVFLKYPNYSGFSRTGSQNGKQKTVKGTPDSSLLLPDGKYVFIEYSTNSTKGISKIEEDIEKCIDTKITKIPREEIAEIIICVNFKLQPYEIQQLKHLLKNTGISLFVYSLDSLALELHLSHRDLVYRYLGLPLNTGQIVSLDVFVEEYNKAAKGISTPIDNTFLHREHEVKLLKDALAEKNLVILTGKAGNGKTKLATEGIKAFLSENNSYSAYCISYKNHKLLDDLYDNFEKDKDYLLFIDDANRIDAFGQIIGFYKTIRTGNLKVLITVRDYALEEINRLCNEHLPQTICIDKFTDEQIIDIVQHPPFNILSHLYYRTIERIADGNPRLAIMMANLSKEKQDLNALNDVSQLFDNYFSTFIKDNGEFSKPLNIKCLGIIAFFNNIPLDNKELTSAILSNFGVDYNSFIDSINTLESLELLETNYSYVKITEQNLANYFFYRAFIKEDYLSFSVLLDNYFENNISRFRDCVVHANNTFGREKVMNKLQPYLRTYITNIKQEEDRVFKFLHTFWYFLPTESFEFLHNYVEKLPAENAGKYDNYLTINNSYYYDQNKPLEVLCNFFRDPNSFTDAIELCIEYARKKPQELSKIIKKIEEHLVFDIGDESSGFNRQIFLFNILNEKVMNEDKLCYSLFFQVANFFLGYKFQINEPMRNYKFSWYRYSIPKTEEILGLRKTIWHTIDVAFNNNASDCLKILWGYTQKSQDVSKEIMETDIPFLNEIIHKHLNNTSFEHCRYVNHLISYFKRYSVTHHALSALSSQFTNNMYALYLKIDFDYFRDKAFFDYEKSPFEYKQLKEAELRNSFLFKNKDEVENFYNQFAILVNSEVEGRKYFRSLDVIINENLSKNFEAGCYLLSKLIENNNELGYYPGTAFEVQLNEIEKTDTIWRIFKNKHFEKKSIWELSFYDSIGDSILNERYAEAVLNTIACMEDNIPIHFGELQRFLKIKPDFFEIILKKVIERNENEGSKVQLWIDFFSTHLKWLGDDMRLIKKGYLQQSSFQHHFDYDGTAFFEILKKDTSFLIDFVKNSFTDNLFRFSEENKMMGFIWEVENIEPVVTCVLDYVVEQEPEFGLMEHYCVIFFRPLNEQAKKRASDFLLNYCKENYTHPSKINVLVSIVRQTLPNLFEKVLLLYISLIQDIDSFTKIYWRGNSTFAVGSNTIAGIKAAEWRNVLSIIEKSDLGIKLIPIKGYLNKNINTSLEDEKEEKMRMYLQGY